MKTTRITIFFICLMFFQAKAAEGDSIFARATWIAVNPVPRSNEIDQIKALKFHEGRLYAGGRFDEIGGVKARGVASFNGTSWETVGSGIIHGSFISAFATDSSGQLFAAGSFDSMDNAKCSNIAQWNGEQWLSYGKDEIPISVKTIAFDENNHCYVSGMAYRDYSTSRTWDMYLNIYTIENDNWKRLISNYLRECCSGVFCDCPTENWSIDVITSTAKYGLIYGGNVSKLPNSERFANVDAIILDDSENVYISGEAIYYYLGITDTAYRLYKIIPRSPLPDTTINITGLHAEWPNYYAINTMVIDSKGNLFMAGSNTCKGIEVWDGKHLYCINGSLDRDVYALALSPDEKILYVGGGFDSAGGLYSPMIAAVDLYRPVKTYSRITTPGGSSTNIRIINSILAVNNPTPGMRLSLYDLSGKLLCESRNGTSINLRRFPHQSLILRISESGRTTVRTVFRW